MFSLLWYKKRAEAVLATPFPALATGRNELPMVADDVARQTLTIKLRVRNKHAARLNAQARANDSDIEPRK